MRVGLLSDIHGNAHALEAVLTAARAQNVERLLCCGDLVGYYYEPDRCLDLLADWNVECVRGNHEDMLRSITGSPELALDIRRRYGSGLDVARDVLTAERLHYLDELPVETTVVIDGKTLLLCHGAPWDPAAYVYPDAPEESFRRCAERGTDYVILGHTHYPLAVRSGATLIINPGSVGQARGTGRGVANWAILDVASGWYRHQATEYLTAAVMLEAQRRDPEVAYLQSILARDVPA